MTAHLAHVLVFKTTIQTLADKQRVATLLDTHNEIHAWTIDLQDIDCVLRVISATLAPETIIRIINQHGYVCAELD